MKNWGEGYARKGRSMDGSAPVFRNHLLRLLDPADTAALRPLLHPFRMELHDVFETPDAPITRVCFPESGIVSVVAASDTEHRIEAGLIGYEGMTGTAVVMGDDRSPHECYVQVAGDGHWISAGDLRRLLETHEAIQRTLLLYVQTFAIQTAQTAVANGRARLDTRLARWLAMAQDRLHSPELPLTHEFLSLMLGVRRAGVTDALHQLEGDGVVRSRRGVVLVRDRGRLEALASTSYGVPEAAYRRMLGDPAGEGLGPEKRSAGETARRA